MEMLDDRPLQMQMLIPRLRYRYRYRYGICIWQACSGIREMFSREKCTISVYLMPMHFECKRQANAISFQSRTGLPSHPVLSSIPVSSHIQPLPPPNPPPSGEIYCALVALLNHLATFASPPSWWVPWPPKWCQQLPIYPPLARWLMGCSSGNVFSLSQPHRRLEVAGGMGQERGQKGSHSKARQQTVFCQLLTNWGLLQFPQKDSPEKSRQKPWDKHTENMRLIRVNEERPGLALNLGQNKRTKISAFRVYLISVSIKISYGGS